MSETDLAAGPVAERVAALVLPILRDLGLELYDLEHAGGTVRVMIARPADSVEQGLDLEAITLVTRLLGRELDHSDPVPGRYTLEVTSPGLERPLRRPDHYRGAIGVLIAVRLHAPIGGTRRLQGILTEVNERGIVLRPEGPAGSTELPADVPLRYDQIDRARTVFLWGPTPKPGGKGTAKGATGRTKRRPAAEAEPDTTTTTTTREAGAS